MRRTESTLNLLRVMCVLLLCLAAAACGRKGAPKPVLPVAPPQIQDLEALVRAGAVELTWEAFKQGEGSEYRYSVRKAEIRWEDRECPDCPPEPFEVRLIDPTVPGAASASMEGDDIVWSDTHIAMNAVYKYQIAIVDRHDRVVSISNPVVVRILPPPPAARDLKAVPERQGIILTWKAGREARKTGISQGGQVQYLLERKAPGGAWEKVSPVPIAATTFTDSAIMPGKAYEYRVTPVIVAEGFHVVGESASTGRTAASDAVAPSPPGNVWVIPAKGGPEIHWTESEGKVGGYHVYRREGGEIVRLTAEPVQHPPFVDRNVQPGAAYGYAVSSVGSSPPHKEGLVSKWAEMRNVITE